MKSIEELEKILLKELATGSHQITTNNNLEYYNKALGNTSVILAGILEQLLKKYYNDWKSGKWIDDGLLTKVNIIKDKIEIWGIMIWGRVDTTNQWTNPFYFEIKTKQHFTAFTQYTFLFGEMDSREIPYEKFQDNRGMWDKQYYSTPYWHPAERNWNYIINKKST